MASHKMDRNQYKALMELQELQFVLTELHLYLDTHPCDEKALKIYNDVARKYDCKLREYQRRYEMLYQLSVDYLDPSEWNWIEGPWPWEIQYR